MNISEIEKAVKTDDHLILLNKPFEKYMYGKMIRIEQINYYYEWDKFAFYLGVFLKYYYTIITQSKLPDTLKDLEEFRNNVMFTAKSNKLAFYALTKVCGFMRVKVLFKTRWMKKHFSMDDWVEIFVYQYLYNVKGVKKNLKDGLQLVTNHQLN